jgi:hypothetical protein
MHGPLPIAWFLLMTFTKEPPSEEVMPSSKSDLVP